MNFTLEELKMLRMALETEIIRREESNSERAKQKVPEYEALLDRVYDAIYEARQNQ